MTEKMTEVVVSADLARVRSGSNFQGIVSKAGEAPQLYIVEGIINQENVEFSMAKTKLPKASTPTIRVSIPQGRNFAQGQSVALMIFPFGVIYEITQESYEEFIAKVNNEDPVAFAKIKEAIDSLK